MVDFFLRLRETMQEVRRRWLMLFMQRICLYGLLIYHLVIAEGRITFFGGRRGVREERENRGNERRLF